MMVKSDPIVTTNVVRAALDDLLRQSAALEEEHKQAERELAAINRQRVEIQRAIAALTVVVSGSTPVQEDMDLTVALRQLLYSEFPQYLSVPEIRDRLKMSDYNVDKHTNVLASIHSVLRRLVEASDAEIVVNAEGTKQRYRLTDQGRTKTLLRQLPSVISPSSEPPKLEDVQRDTSVEPPPPPRIKRLLRDSQERRERLSGKLTLPPGLKKE